MIVVNQKLYNYTHYAFCSGVTTWYTAYCLSGSRIFVIRRKYISALESKVYRETLIGLILEHSSDARNRRDHKTINKRELYEINRQLF